jgi:cold shock CspA family protein
MDRGYGFIHRNDCDGMAFESLSEGQEVEFEKGQGRDGRPQANKVRLTEIQASDEGRDDQGGGEDEVKA